MVMFVFNLIGKSVGITTDLDIIKIRMTKQYFPWNPEVK